VGVHRRTEACRLLRGVTRLDGAQGQQEASLAPPCSKLWTFGSKCTVLKKVLVTSLGFFGAPLSDLAQLTVIWHPRSCSAPWEMRPLCPPHYTPEATATLF